MNGSLPEKLSDPNRYEPVEDWLYCALVKVGRLPENNAADKRLNQAARTLLRSIEAELLTTPGVWRCRDGMNHIKFKFGSRSVEFTVIVPGVWLALRKSPCEAWKPKSHAGWPGQFARDEIRWVFPTAHMTDEKAMIATSRGQ